MAEPASLDDLEAELRRMEEELAALKGAPKKPKKEKKAEEAESSPSPEPSERKFGLKIPKLKLPAKAEAEPQPQAEAPAADPAPPAAEASSPSPEPSSSPSSPKFALKVPKIGLKRKADTDVAVHRVAEPAAVQVVAAPSVPQPEFLPRSGRWSQEERRWKVKLDAEPVVVRRILDADGNVVREEEAPRDLVASAPEPDAPPEAPAARPLHALAERLGKRKEKARKGGFFRRGRD